MDDNYSGLSYSVFFALSTVQFRSKVYVMIRKRVAQPVDVAPVSEQKRGKRSMELNSLAGSSKLPNSDVPIQLA
jgi:hypothetical protein